jgi:2-polyprenyl-3-methyl-5-hydroxy-6-metoxy-1,4-benzoquinol methylase
MILLGPVAPDLTVRRCQAELMDDPALDVERHHRALRALARINRVSGAAARVWREIRARAEAGRTPVRILDVACGGGDVLRAVARRAAREELEVELHGCDLSPVALAWADRAWAEGASERRLPIHLFAHDAVADPLPDGYDVVTTSLFLHHLERSTAVQLLANLAAATAGTVLVQDLRRTRLGYAFAWVGLHTLTASDVARTDGLRSVRSAFTIPEVHALAAEAGLAGATVQTAWPQRFVLRWGRA